MVTLGVISDTHIPDRARSLERLVLDVFQSAGVKAILHAGDVSTPRVITQLEEIAPVHAVRGNRDWVALAHLPYQSLLTFDGIKVGVVLCSCSPLAEETIPTGQTKNDEMPLALLVAIILEPLLSLIHNQKLQPLLCLHADSRLASNLNDSKNGLATSINIGQHALGMSV